MTASITSDSLRIGDVAKRSGITVDTLRYYEREGLLPGPIRSIRGARRFPAETVGRVRFVKQAQAAGLTLRDIKQLVGLQRGQSLGSCQRMRRVLAQRLSEIDVRARELEAFRTVLDQHIRACDRALKNSAQPRCPSLDALDEPSRATDDAGTAT